MLCTFDYHAFYCHRGHLVRENSGTWKDLTRNAEPFTHQQLKSRFSRWKNAPADTGDFEIIHTFDYASEDDLHDAIKLIEDFNTSEDVDGDKYKSRGNRYNRDDITQAINAGQSQRYITEKYGISRRQYFYVKSLINKDNSK
ncbi:hypothetical protein NNV00_003191 [Escherichia coli]|uniref:hypothetical protein n=1 Tax=Escherichia coli TaxID=562 RepID=UPI0018F0FB91|nr:hypothetical protein [Escherichia coli]EJM0923242.1 hypothetical protein [Escherichia coli]MBJ7173940.1 hypothetical protein [Escherichia coli]